MTATTAPTAGHGDGHDHGHAHGGGHYTSLGLDNKKIAIWTFIGSECMLFASLISTYLIYKGRSPEGPFPHTEWTNPATGVGYVVRPLRDLGGGSREFELVAERNGRKQKDVLQACRGDGAAWTFRAR